MVCACLKCGFKAHAMRGCGDGDLCRACDCMWMMCILHTLCERKPRRMLRTLFGFWLDFVRPTATRFFVDLTPKIAESF